MKFDAASISSPASSLTRTPTSLLPLMSLAAGLVAANIYYAQPILAQLAYDTGLRPALSGSFITATQLGYAAGLTLLVPLADAANPKRLIATLLLLTVAALTGLVVARTLFAVMLSFSMLGMLSVVIQILVTVAAAITAPAAQGRAIGAVTSGVVLGILVARVLSAPLTEWLHWRGLYLASATLILFTAFALTSKLPSTKALSMPLSYRALLLSIPRLLGTERLLRVRAALALLVFMAFGALWSSLALMHASAPFSLGAGDIAWFGLAGVGGMVGARCAGRLFDRGWGQTATGGSLALMLAAWWPISCYDQSPWLVFVGVLLFDLAGQMAHVCSQCMLFRDRPSVRARLVAAYMLFYAIGIAIGAVAAITLFSTVGWLGVCALGATINTVALIVWAATR